MPFPELEITLRLLLLYDSSTLEIHSERFSEPNTFLAELVLSPEARNTLSLCCFVQEEANV